MRKEISPEMYNYNKFPGPQFVQVDKMVASGDYRFELVADAKDSFDAKAFSQRFSEILLKYDYIVGDWGSEQLRLKGFYKSERSGKALNSISRLDDYLKEYCYFGCAYFVLENPEPQLVTFEDEHPAKRKRKSNHKKKGQTNSHFKSQKRQDSKRRDEQRYRKQQEREIKDAKQHFVIRKKK